MKIKRYSAGSMREALALIRAEQGEDAVILSNRRLPEGVEVVSAVDYDAALMGDATRQIMPPAAADEQGSPPPISRPEPASEPAPRPVAQRKAVIESLARPEPVMEGGYQQVQRELQGMRRLLESELAVLGWKSQCESDPVASAVLEELSALDIAPDVTRVLASRLPRRTNARNPRHIPMALLTKHLPTAEDATCRDGGVVAVVGPTGVGKTTTIAKLAARWCLQHGNEGLALVSTDTYRIGARDQLQTYARILDVPMHVAEGGRQLAQVIERLRHKRLVLIDTAGMGQRDPRIPEQLESLRLGLGGARVLLALPAGGEARALDETVRVFGRIAPAACVLTKIDEAASLGAALSAVLRRNLPIAWLCDGQRVPEDLHAAEARRLWLVRTALVLRERAPALRDDRYMASHFGRVHAHA